MVCFLVCSFEFRSDLLFTTINRTVMQMTSSRNSTTPTPAKVGVMTSTAIADASFEELEFPAGKKEEGNVLFNDALNTFYFTVIWRQTYG